MTLLWVLIGLISLIVCAVIFQTLAWRNNVHPLARAEFDITVYKDQLSELDRDVHRGFLNADEAASARTEIERRILTLADAAAEQAEEPNRDALSPVAIGLALVTPSAALVAYIVMGTPELPNLPYAERDIAAEARQVAEQRQAQEIEAQAQRLAKRLENEPDNLQGWMLLSNYYTTSGRAAEALAAVKKAHDLAPNNPYVLLQYAEALIPTQGNIVSAQASDLFNRSLAADPRNPRARYYLALAKAQANDVRGAIQDWVDLILISPPDAPSLTTVRRQIVAASKELGVDPGSFTPSAEALAMGPSPSTSVAPGPSRENVEAAHQMTAEERQVMIRGMVQRLADRLEEEPDDPEGWRRLANAYRVLDEDAKAAEADARAKAAKR